MASRLDGGQRAPTLPMPAQPPTRINGGYNGGSAPPPPAPTPSRIGGAYRQPSATPPLRGAPPPAPGAAGAPGVKPTSPWQGRPPAASTGGTQSGPTTVEDWFQKRANGADPGWEYATGRATDQINGQYAARGGYNSSGALNQIGDMFANATTQREGQLDKLANDSTTAHQNALNSMFATGLGLANGQSNTNWNYAAGAGNAQADNTHNLQDLILGKSQVDAAKMKSLTDLGLNGVKAYAGIPGVGGGGGGGGSPYGGGGGYGTNYPTYSPYASPKSEYV